MSAPRLARVFYVAAGAGDAGTGALLVGAPRLALGILGIPVPSDTAYVRFLGVFVGAVGLAYLYPLIFFAGPARRVRVVAALEWTAGVRLGVALFVAVAIGTELLAEPWFVVGLFDALVALVQLGLLARGTFADVG